MNETILNKSKTILEEIFKKDSEINLFALFKLEGTNSWDFVLGGKKLDASTDNINWVSDIIRKTLTTNELAGISRIVLLKSDEPFIQNINSVIEVVKESNYMRVENLQINGLLIKEGYVIYSFPLSK